MSDIEVAAVVAMGAWERLALADVGGVADACQIASAHELASEFVDLGVEIEVAFEEITHERTIRVSTDLSWTLGG